MRISTLQIYNIASKGIASANEAMVKTQEQMSTGQRVLSPADDPVAATKIMQLENEIERITQYENNINIAENNLSLEETVLKSVTNLIQRMQELTIQAGNTGVYTSTEYEAMAVEVDSRIDELLSMANTRNANGDYIFSGYQSGEPAFVGDVSTGFTYQGDEGQLNIKISDSTKIASTDSGKDIFLNIPSSSYTFNTSTNPLNRSQPPMEISIGNVTDQEAFDDFYPEDIVITFNPLDAVEPPAANFTVTERSTGNVIEHSHVYVAAEEIEYKGASFRITGDPFPGEAVPTTRDFGDDAAVVFAGSFSTTIEISVGGITETLDFVGTPSDASDVVNMLNGSDANAEKLARLGIIVDEEGFHMPTGFSFSIKSDGSADAVLGLDTTVSGGRKSTEGVLVQTGDQIFVDSTDKEGLLTTMSRLSAALKNVNDSDPDTKTELADTIQVLLQNLKNADVRVTQVTAEVGSRFNIIETTKNLHSDTELVSREILADIRDLDYAEATTRLSAQSLILEAAQASFITVSRLTLFDRL